MDDFTSRYYSLKTKGYSDLVIAKTLFIGLSTLKRLKKKHGVKSDKTPMPNKQGLSEKQLKQAESKGIKRSVVLMRVRVYGWGIEKAISTPITPLDKRRKCHGKTFRY